jgi:hypothetical protein
MSLVEATGALPYPGGLFDQDPEWIERMKVYYKVRAQKQEVDQKMAEAKSKSKAPR